MGLMEVSVREVMHEDPFPICSLDAKGNDRRLQASGTTDLTV